MKRRPNAGAIIATLSVLVCWPAGVPELGAQPPAAPIDLVIALDVSGTMRGLIDATRVKLWEVVNDLAAAEPTPRLRVGLITFGNQRGSRSSGWVQVETDLTADLDRVSERLFRVRSRGADELVGRVLKTALEELTWSPDEEQGLKLLILAGNESADQDPDVGFREMSLAAREAGLFVTAIYCGTNKEAQAESWRELAELAEGRFSTLDHQAGAAIVATPFDRELAALGDVLNETFVTAGRRGAEEQRTRTRQDQNARSLGLAVAATRALTKASPLYTSELDLVSRYQAGELDPARTAERDLPRQLRRLSPDERVLYLEEMLELRDEIRGRIAELGVERQQYVAAQAAGPEIDDPRSFDHAVRRTIRERAEAAGFIFPER